MCALMPLLALSTALLVLVYRTAMRIAPGAFGSVIGAAPPRGHGST